jgi:5'-3' exonuclease
VQDDPPQLVLHLPDRLLDVAMIGSIAVRASMGSSPLSRIMRCASARMLRAAALTSTPAPTRRPTAAPWTGKVLVHGAAAWDTAGTDAVGTDETPGELGVGVPCHGGSAARLPGSDDNPSRYGSCVMEVHLIDGTYELFRYHFAPNNRDLHRGATVGVLATLLQLVADGATHVGVATDHVIESFRNDLWPGYKSSAGMPRELLAQFPVVEDAMAAAGFVVWPQVELEADDGLATAALMAAADDRVERVVICTPDKDLGQCVGGKVVQFDRRKGAVLDAAGVEARLGVPPPSIPDLLALVGDSADGFPGLPGWGSKSAAAVLRRWGHLESIPSDPVTWESGVRGAAKLNAVLRDQFELALLFRRIATVETDAPVSGSVDELRWVGPADPAAFGAFCERLDAGRLRERMAQVTDLVASRA